MQYIRIGIEGTPGPKGTLGLAGTSGHNRIPCSCSHNSIPENDDKPLSRNDKRLYELSDVVLDCGFELIENNPLPKNIKKITFSSYFDRLIPNNSLPENLEYVDFGHHFNHKLTDFNIPETVEVIKLGYFFNRSLNELSKRNLKSIITNHYKGLVSTELLPIMDELYKERYETIRKLSDEYILESIKSAVKKLPVPSKNNQTELEYNTSISKQLENEERLFSLFIRGILNTKDEDKLLDYNSYQFEFNNVFEIVYRGLWYNYKVIYVGRKYNFLRIHMSKSYVPKSKTPIIIKDNDNILDLTDIIDDITENND